MGPHSAYIIASYIAAGVILGGLVVASLLANRAAAKLLAKLEKERAA